MKLRKYIIIHCTATPEGRDIQPQQIIDWHIAGNGWKQVGYADLVLLDGSIHNFVENNYDNYVDSWEITNGAKGCNQEALHVCYVGGLDKNRNPKNTLTEAQELALKNRILHYISYWQDIKIGGHNQFSNKACPSFDTVAMLRKWGIPEKNIFIK